MSKNNDAPSQHYFAFPFLLVASVALTVQGAQNCSDGHYHYDKRGCTNETAYAVAVGSVSLAFLLLLNLLEKVVQQNATTLKPFFAVFLALWWFIAVCVLTFDAPYTQTGNGFFACWVGFLASLFWACDCCATFQEYASKASASMSAFPVTALLICSSAVA